jgi:outer membrane protein assembly factor BamB
VKKQALAAFFVLSVLVQSPLASADTPVEMLQQSAPNGGIIVQLGCADVGSMIETYANAPYTVQLLDRDAELVAAAKAEIQAADCAGKLSARVLTTEGLPLIENLVNMLVVEDAQRVDEEEQLRVIRPLGLLVARGGDGWQKKIKPWPQDMDEWTHFLHSASGNAVSKDGRIGPPRRLQWASNTRWGRSHEMNNSFPALVTARGRMYYVFDEGVTGMEDARLGERWTLYARDAFNGTLLWGQPLPTWGSHTWNSRALRFFGGDIARRLVANGDKLYVTFEFGGPVAVLDGATGETLGEIPGTEGAQEILADGDDVVVVSRPQLERRGAAVKLTCYNARTSKTTWTAEANNIIPQLTIITPESVVLNDRQNVVSLNRNDGSPRWKHDLATSSGNRGSRSMMLFADGKVIAASRAAIVALSAANGEVVWKSPGPKGQSMREYDVFFARDTIWCSGDGGTIAGYKIEDGSPIDPIKVGDVQSYGHHLRCYRAKATEDYLITQFRGIEFLSLADEPHSQNDWIRGTCTYGVMPANGVLYVPPHSCLCYPGSMFTGLNALSAETEDATALLANAEIGPIEKGPAFGFIGDDIIPASSDWTTYRHDARRTGATANALPGMLKRSWKIDLGTEVATPVAADGRVFVAAKNEHTIHALDAATGKTLWTFTADARIDSPPSVHRGLLVFGGADGFLYCVRAGDGQLAWRRRLAPASQWLASEGQLESVWRLHGSVAILGNLAYCSAGRSSFVDGGIFLYAVDIATGEVKHRANLNTIWNTREDRDRNAFVPSYHIEGAQSDILVAEGGFVYLNQERFAPDLKHVPGKYLSKAESTGRPSINLDDKPYVNEDIYSVRWAGKDWSKYDKLATILVDENETVGERELGRHLFTTSGFLDGSFFNRTFWMYSSVWPGFNHANLAPKSGQILVIGPKNTYALKAYTSRYALSPRLDPQTKGYLLIADDNENDPTLDPRAWGKDKGMGFSRGAEPVWHQWLPVRVTAMVLAGDTLVVCGPPDVVPEDEPMAAFDGKLGSRLWTISATDGTTIAKHELSETPLFDGMIAASDRLFLCTKAGEVICMVGQ